MLDFFIKLWYYILAFDFIRSLRMVFDAEISTLKRMVLCRIAARTSGMFKEEKTWTLLKI